MNKYLDKVNEIENRLSNSNISDSDRAELTSLIDEAKSSINNVKKHDDYLKSKFEDMAFSVPADELKYYRGVLVTGLKVYLGDYDQERRKREMDKLDKELAKNRESAFIPIYVYGLIITSMGLITCIIGVLMSIFS